jgi:hypothetical protein
MNNTTKEKLEDLMDELEVAARELEDEPDFYSEGYCSDSFKAAADRHTKARAAIMDFFKNA